MDVEGEFFGDFQVPVILRIFGVFGFLVDFVQVLSCYCWFGGCTWGWGLGMLQVLISHNYGSDLRVISTPLPQVMN